MIRLANIEDLPAVLEVYDSLQGLREYDQERAAIAIRKMIKNNSVIVFIHKHEVVGAIAGIFTEIILTGEGVFLAQFFFVLPVARGLASQYLSDALHFLSGGSAERLVFQLPEFYSKSLEGFFLMNGFKPSEISYSRPIPKNVSEG